MLLCNLWESVTEQARKLRPVEVVHTCVAGNFQSVFKSVCGGQNDYHWTYMDSTNENNDLQIKTCANDCSLQSGLWNGCEDETNSGDKTNSGDETKELS